MTLAIVQCNFSCWRLLFAFTSTTFLLFFHFSLRLTWCAYCLDYCTRQILRWHCFVCIQSNLCCRLGSKNCSNSIYKSIIFSILAIGAFSFSLTFLSSARRMSMENEKIQLVNGSMDIMRKQESSLQGFIAFQIGFSYIHFMSINYYGWSDNIAAMWPNPCNQWIISSGPQQSDGVRLITKWTTDRSLFFIFSPLSNFIWIMPIGFWQYLQWKRIAYVKTMNRLP